jgi:hypothetical protein
MRNFKLLLFTKYYYCAQIVRWVMHVVRLVDKINVYRILVGKPDKKKPVRRPGHIELRLIGMLSESME